MLHMVVFTGDVGKHSQPLLVREGEGKQGSCCLGIFIPYLVGYCSISESM